MKLIFLILLFAASAELPLLARPAQIILLRHAEKPGDESDIHLSLQGEARARALVRLFTTTAPLTNYGTPAALFATHQTSHGHSRRTSETLEPLAKDLKVRIKTPCAAKEYEVMAERVLHDHNFDGKTVVICWVHDYLPELAKALGVRPKPASWKGDSFDRLWVITYHHKKAMLTDLPQRLLPGDSSH